MVRHIFYRSVIALVSGCLLGLSPQATGASDATPFTKPLRMPSGQAPLDTHELLVQFHQDPGRILNSFPAKVDENGYEVIPVAENIPVDEASRQKQLIYRDELREQFCRRAGIDCESGGGAEPLAKFGDRDTAEDFLYLHQIIRRPAEMEKKNLMHHTLQKSPWSDSFWPINRGMIARRFADSSFPSSSDWTQNFNYIQARPAWSTKTDTMSPAEKYDYLVGDRAWSMTDTAWNRGRRYVNKYGFVPTWTGLCHGWAPASFMFDRPMRSVTVKSYNGGSVTFFPSDIKALASMLWGEAPPIVKFTGRRCKKNNPTEDGIGRVTDDTCFDVNPGTWHLSIVNQLGVAKRSFVMDSTYDFEVWNYPVYAYSYVYFNPQTLAVSRRLSNGVIPLRDFTIDKFKKYRNPQTKSIVGIAMDITYSIPIQPSRRVIDKDRYHTIRYVYDLELDGLGNVVGGEWYSNFHPDFLWNPAPDARALSKPEKSLETDPKWEGDGRVSETIHNLARKASVRGEPLAVVVERLAKMASLSEDGTVPRPPREETAEPVAEIED